VLEIFLLQKDGPRKCLINIVFNSVLVSQYDRIKELNHELQEKAEAAELQISTISREYRTMLQEKEVYSLDKTSQLHSAASILNSSSYLYRSLYCILA
jgi:hypothetical protein